MISCINLDKYHQNIFNNISYKYYRTILNIIHFIQKDLLDKYYDMNNYDNLCKYFLNYLLFKQKKINLFSAFDLTNKSPLGIEKYFVLYNLKKKIDNNKLLILSNSDKTHLQASYLNIDFDLILFPNTEYSVDIEQIKKKNNESNKYNNESNKYNNEISYQTDFNLENKKKYNYIFIRSFEFMFDLYLPFMQLTKLPSIILFIINSLTKLNKNGNLYINLQILIVNNAFEKIIMLLVNSFNDVKIIYNSMTELDANFNIECTGFLDNIEMKKINELIKITKKIQKYNYSLCQFMHFFYHTKKEKIPFMYELDISNFPKEFKSKQTKMNIIDDFNLSFELNSSIKSQYIINEIKNKYISYFNNINYIIKRYINVENKEKFTLDINFFNKIQIQKISSFVKILKENKIPFNKSYLVYIDKYNINLVNQLHSLENSIKSLLVKPKTFNQEQQWKKLKSFNKSSQQLEQSTSSNLKKKTHKKTSKEQQHLKPYYFEELNKFQEMYKLGIQVNNSVLESIFENNDKIQSRKVPQVVKFITDNYSRGVAKYINENSKFKLSFNISNGFTKMWEILETIPSLLLNNQKQDHQQLKVFFIAEAPGQWIYAINYYTQKKLTHVKKVDWRATSLNPKHPLNLERYGTGILDDAYGFIKHYPKNWLWGVDETGDITKAENIRWYHQYVKEWDKPDLITGDAGLQSDNPLINQKLELAQAVMVAGVSQKGGNCIIKHFLTYNPNIPETEHSNGFFINYLYLYYLMFEDVYLLKPLSSNPVSSEFYLVGKKFIGLNQEIFEKLLNLIENFEVNMCFFDKKDIPEHFKKQVFVFIEKLTRLNVDFIDIQNNLLTCLKTRDEVIEKATECRKYLNPKYMEEIQESKFKKWCELYNFH